MTISPGDSTRPRVSSTVLAFASLISGGDYQARPVGRNRLPIGASYQAPKTERQHKRKQLHEKFQDELIEGLHGMARRRVNQRRHRRWVLHVVRVDLGIRHSSSPMR